MKTDSFSNSWQKFGPIQDKRQEQYINFSVDLRFENIVHSKATYFGERNDQKMWTCFYDKGTDLYYVITNFDDFEVPTT